MSTQLTTLVTAALDDLKAENIITFDVSTISSFTDTIVICSGRSKRHVKSISENVMLKAKEHKVDLIGTEGGVEAEWVLVDLGDIVIHVMLPETRDYYNLEGLWNCAELTSA